jgi:hypothetical protein
MSGAELIRGEIGIFTFRKVSFGRPANTIPAAEAICGCLFFLSAGASETEKKQRKPRASRFLAAETVPE